MRLLLARLGVCGVFFLSAGCTGDVPPESSKDGDGDGSGDGSGGGDDGSDGSCVEDTQCAGYEICEGSECVDGDRNNAVEEAESILWDDTRTGYVNPENDVDYFTFDADGGEFVRISLTIPEDFEVSDTVVELRKSNGKVVTTADAFATETGVTGVDAVVFAYLDEAGTYTISVEDDGSAGRDDEGVTVGSRDYSYTLALEQWNGHTDEDDDLGSPSALVVLEAERLWSSVGVVLEEEGDADYIQLEHAVDGASLYLDGNQDLTGSDASPRVRLLTESGTPLTDKVGVGPEEYALAPTLESGTYIIEISDADGGGSSNHWTWVHLISRVDTYEHTLDNESNDSQVSANLVDQEEFENSGGNLFTRGQLQGDAEDGEDEDWYRFSVDYEESWLVACLNSSVLGSTMAPDLEIYNSGGELVESASGSELTDPTTLIENLTATPGDYYLRVIPPIDVTGGPGAWYRLNLFVASFEVGGYACPDGS
jgi:hypothetical protein